MQTKTLGIGIIIIGVLIMVYSGFNYVTSKRVVDIGSIHVNRETNHRVSVSPYIGLIFLAGGLFILLKKKSG